MTVRVGTQVTVLCEGCGEPFIYTQKRGRPRKWCTERCRKLSCYGGACEMCGAPTNGSDGRGPKASRVCVPCNGILAAERQREAFRPRRELVERLWAEGFTGRQVAAEMGWSTKHPSARISGLRSRGYDLPFHNPALSDWALLNGSNFGRGEGGD